MKNYCSRESHEALKVGGVKEFLSRVEYRGVQGLEGEFLILGNCPRCRSTVAVSVGDISLAEARAMAEGRT